MGRSLSDYDSERDRYERIEQPWVCGRATEGHPCHIGPDRHGHCRVHLECVPHFQDNRWHCTRPKGAGGTCKEGPLPDGRCPNQPPPCQPRRSLMSRRRVFTFFVASAALGVLLLFSSGESGKAFLSPGQLSVHHKGMDGQCMKCHSAEEGHAVVWNINATDAVAQSFQCIDCHKFGEHALNPHNVPPDQLAELTDRIRRNVHTPDEPAWIRLARMGPESAHSSTGNVACAACHHEHRGREHDLKQISQKHCQLCHTKPFHSFVNGHPDFASYPYKRRMRIHFDHSNHYGRHFALFKRLMPQGRKPESCTSCHAPDPTGTKMVLRGFEHSCASCHAADIERENVLPRLTFLKLPRIDPGAKDWDDVRLGNWPSYFSKEGGYLGSGPLEQLPPFMTLLLADDPEFQQAIRTLAKTNLGNLETADANTKRAVQQYTQAIRRLVTDLEKNGETAIRTRIEQSLGKKLTEETVRALAGPRSSSGHLVEAVRAASKRWFVVPSGKAEVPAAKGVPARDAPTHFGNWSINSGNYAVTYKPGRHADPFLKACLDLCAAYVPMSARDVADLPLAERAAVDQFKKLSAPDSAGLCLKCHTVDRQPNGQLAVNWLGYRTRPYRKSFTTFSHEPHLKTLGSAGCTKCHVRDQKLQVYRREFHHRDLSPNFSQRAMATSGFRSMRKAQCATCHTPQSAGDSCLQCHSYHVGHFPPPRLPP